MHGHATENDFLATDVTLEANSQAWSQPDPPQDVHGLSIPARAVVRCSEGHDLTRSWVCLAPCVVAEIRQHVNPGRCDCEIAGQELVVVELVDAPGSEEKASLLSVSVAKRLGGPIVPPQRNGRAKESRVQCSDGRHDAGCETEVSSPHSMCSRCYGPSRSTPRVCMVCPENTTFGRPVATMSGPQLGLRWLDSALPLCGGPPYGGKRRRRFQIPATAPISSGAEHSSCAVGTAPLDRGMSLAACSSSESGVKPPHSRWLRLTSRASRRLASSGPRANVQGLPPTCMVYRAYSPSISHGATRVESASSERELELG